MPELSCVIPSSSQVIDPSGLWLGRIPAACRHEAPTLVREADQDLVVCEGATTASVSVLAGWLRTADQQRMTGRCDEDAPSADRLEVRGPGSSPDRDRVRRSAPRAWVSLQASAEWRRCDAADEIRRGRTHSGGDR